MAEHERKYIEACEKIMNHTADPDTQDDLVLGYQELLYEDPKKYQNCVTYRDAYKIAKGTV